MYGDLTLVLFKSSPSIENSNAFVRAVPDHQLSGLSFGTQLKLQKKSPKTWLFLSSNQ